MKKRVLSLFLTFVLSFSMMPMSAFAEGTGAVAEQEAQSSGDTAYVGEMLPTRMLPTRIRRWRRRRR